MEIERKYLVVGNSYRSQADKVNHLVQAYLNPDPRATVRIRMSDDKAWLTIKGLNYGIERNEWEYEIPIDDARSMLKECTCSGQISKTRYHVGRWEIDEFHGALQGLVIAEIELTAVDEVVELPDFVGKEVSDDERYYNSSLAQAPYPPTDE